MTQSTHNTNLFGLSGYSLSVFESMPDGDSNVRVKHVAKETEYVCVVYWASYCILLS
jgi:hypothetical protein